MPVIARYAAVTVPPLLLLILGATAWGGFAYVALIWLTVVAAIADRLLEPPLAADPDPEMEVWTDTLSVGLGIGHLLVLIASVSALATASLTFGQSIALFLATASFFGQVSHPNAHELIHRRNIAMRALGAAVYTSVGFGHHVSAHRLVHHRYVGTEQDPNTPLPGESFWSYLPRAWRGSFEAGIVCEIDRLEAKDRGPNHVTNPYWVWLGGAALALIASIFIGGIGGPLVLLGLGALTGAQILMSDYVQHYGLQRMVLDNGRVEPVSAHHSWNAPRGFSSYLMMNAPAHSEHHMHPDRPYDQLDPNAAVPTLPFSMPVMATIAMVPSIWFRMMDKRAVKVMEAAIAARNAAPAAPSPQPQPQPQPAAAPRPASSTAQAAPAAAAPAPAAAPPAEPDQDPETAALIASIRAATQ